MNQRIGIPLVCAADEVPLARHNHLHVRIPADEQQAWRARWCGLLAPGQTRHSFGCPAAQSGHDLSAQCRLGREQQESGASWHASLSSSFVHDTCTVQSPACRVPRRAFAHNATAMGQRKLAVLASAVQEASWMTPYQEDRMDNCQPATHRPLRCSRVRRASMSPAYLRLAVHPCPVSPCRQTCRGCWLRRVDEIITRTFPPEKGSVLFLGVYFNLGH
jgi:hypothetical protein